MDLIAQTRAAFEPGGLLSRAEPQFRPRAGQTAMAVAVAETIRDAQVLVVEAGTGVGKTYSYLVPALLSGQRVLVSTATKALQDQLFARDLPRLVQSLGLPLRMARLKGRSSYLCLERLAQSRQSRTPLDPQLLRQIARVEDWARSTRTGDVAELPGLAEQSQLAQLVTSTKDNCLGRDCPQWQACHVNRARSQALEADVTVVNHHLFFADGELRESGVSPLLPAAGVVVLDEAHQLNDTGIQFAGRTLSSQQLLGFARDVLREATAQARGMADWLVLVAQLEQGLRGLRLVVAEHGVGSRLRWQARVPDGLDEAQWLPALQILGRALQAVVQALAVVAETAISLQQLLERGRRLLATLADFARPAGDDTVRWLEPLRQHLRMTESPLTIARLLQERLAVPTAEGVGAVHEDPVDGAGGATPDVAAPVSSASPGRAWIFTSATLGDEDELHWFTEACGLREARILTVDSPFDYARQAAWYVPLALPAPGEAGHSAAVARLAGDGAERLGGRTLVLTTTLKALETIGQLLQQRFGLLEPIDVLVQGQGSKQALMERFRAGTVQGRGCVLVASSTFWEGVDIPGDALQLVVIDKLPFPPPDDPLVEARCRQLEALGRNAFADFMLPEAAMALKQGAGRLIRQESDRGLLVVADPRLRTKAYGPRLVRALPPMRLLGSEADWLAALDALVAGEAPTPAPTPTPGAA